MRSRGFTLIEVLAGLVILGIIMTTSLGIFFERQRTLLQAEEMVIAWQALANEAEVLRHVPYAALVPGSKGAFRSEPDLRSQLPGVDASIAVRQPKPEYRFVTLTIRWREGLKSAELTIVRGDTGGSALW